MKSLLLGLATLLAGPALAQTSQLTGSITGLAGKPLLYRYMRQGALVMRTNNVDDITKKLAALGGL